MAKQEILENGNKAIDNMLGSGAELYKMIHELLERREQLLSSVKEYNLIDDALKKYFQGVPNFSIGKFFIKGIWKEKKIYEIPEQIKKKYLKTNRSWDIEIKTINF